MSSKFSKTGGRLPPQPKPVKFNLPVEQYTPYALLVKLGKEEISEKDLRREYTRLRNIAQKRIVRLKADPLLKRLENVKDAVSTGFPTLKEIGKSSTALAGHLAGLRSFLTKEESTVYGARRKFERNVRKAREAAGDFIDDETYPDFDRFMRFARETTRGFRIGSPEIADFFDDNSGKYSTQEELEDAFYLWAETGGEDE
jgi:hypothetical protein